jgi:hypothetical protein
MSAEEFVLACSLELGKFFVVCTSDWCGEELEVLVVEGLREASHVSVGYFSCSPAPAPRG